MSKVELNELIKIILKNVRSQLSYEFGFTNEQIEDMIRDSHLVESIKHRPTVYGHMSPDQVIDVVLG